MRVLILLGFVAAASAYINDNDSYSIIADQLIPLGNKIRQAEERNVNERIVGGSAAVLGEVPYQVGTLINYFGITGTGVCGGSIITANRVISAAHCWNDGVHQAFRVTVVAGSVTIFSGGVRIDSKVVAMHPLFSVALARNDVSVIYLPTPLTFSDVISPIALPSGPEVFQSFAGVTGIASGFGLTSNDGSISTSSNLQAVALNIISNSVCWLSYPIILQDSNICTSGSGGIGTCRGDSGGPLAVNSNGRRVLVGVTSFGHRDGCESGNPAVYARITTFLNFINQHIN